MIRGTDDPTDVLDEDDGEPTEHLESGAGDEPTERLDPETGQTEEMRTRRLAKDPPPPPSPPPAGSPPGDDSRQRGLAMLVGSILAALILVGIYIASGGTDYKPSAAADPCDVRPWTDPANFEEAAQQFALSAVDGAACDLDVSREELTRSLVDDASRQAFQDEQGLSDSEVEEALRAGLNRAIDDAENAAVIDALTATGLRAAVRFLPVDQMIPLIEDASGFLEGRSISDLSDVFNGVIDSFGGDDGAPGTTGGTGDTGETGNLIPGDLGDQIERGLRDQLPPEVERNLPDDLQKRAEDGLDQLLNP